MAFWPALSTVRIECCSKKTPGPSIVLLSVGILMGVSIHRDCWIVFVNKYQKIGRAHV